MATVDELSFDDMLSLVKIMASKSITVIITKYRNKSNRILYKVEWQSEGG